MIWLIWILRGLDLRDGLSDGDRLFKMLQRGESQSADDFVRTLFIGGMSIEQIVDGPFRNAFIRLGELWEVEGDAGIMWEHRATQLGIGILQSLRTLIPEPIGPQPRAVGAAPASDPYQLPSMAVQAALEGAGFEATNCGPDTPPASLAAAIDETRPLLVWISSTASALPLEPLEPVVRAAQQVGAHIVIGGQRGIDGAILPDRVSAMETLSELTAFARGLAAQWRARQ